MELLATQQGGLGLNYIPDTVKPRLLYTKYLHHSLTTGYVELEA
jgi:hypothetical protein